MGLKTRTVRKQVYCCDICSWESDNTTDFNTCLVCGKNYCIFNCKSNLYFVYNQHICRICKENPIIEDLTNILLEKWRNDRKIVESDYRKISEFALKLDRRFNKNWLKHFTKYNEQKEQNRLKQIQKVIGKDESGSN